MWAETGRVWWLVPKWSCCPWNKMIQNKVYSFSRKESVMKTHYLAGKQKLLLVKWAIFREYTIPLRPLALHPGNRSLWRLWTAAHCLCHPCSPVRGHRPRRRPGSSGAPADPSPRTMKKSPKNPKSSFLTKHPLWLFVLQKIVIGSSSHYVSSTHLIPQVGIFRLFFHYLCWTDAFRLNLVQRHKFMHWENVQESNGCLMAEDWILCVCVCVCVCVCETTVCVFTNWSSQDNFHCFWTDWG